MVRRQFESKTNGYTDKVDYEFDLIRERLFVRNGEDTGRDALIRSDNGKPISIVSPKYKIVTHKEANNFAETLLQKNGIEYDGGHVSVTADGARFLREFRLTGKSFMPSVKGNISTALDGKGEPDLYYPTIILRNSCDKTSGLDFIFGGYRLVCSNGLMIGHDIAKISNPHITNPNYKKIGDTLLDKLEANVEGFRRSYETLNSQPADKYLQLMVAQGILNTMMAKAMWEVSKGTLDVEFEDEGKLSRITASKELSAYALMQIVTEVITHRSRKYNKAVEAQQKIAKIFK